MCRHMCISMSVILLADTTVPNIKTRAKQNSSRTIVKCQQIRVVVLYMLWTVHVTAIQDASMYWNFSFIKGARALFVGLSRGRRRNDSVVNCMGGLDCVTHPAPTHFWELQVRILIPRRECWLSTRTRLRGSFGVRCVQFMSLGPTRRQVNSNDNWFEMHALSRRKRSHSSDNAVPEMTRIKQIPALFLWNLFLMGKVMLSGFSARNQYSSSPLGSSRFTKTTKWRSLSKLSNVVVFEARCSGQST